LDEKEDFFGLAIIIHSTVQKVNKVMCWSMFTTGGLHGPFHFMVPTHDGSNNFGKSICEEKDVFKEDFNNVVY